MRKHIVDQPKTVNKSGMLNAFKRIQLSQYPRLSTLAAQRLPRDRSIDGRVRAFTRIDRGYLA